MFPDPSSQPPAQEEIAAAAAAALRPPLATQPSESPRRRRWWIQREGWAFGSARSYSRACMYVCVAEGLAIAGGIGLHTLAVLSTAAAAAVMAVVVAAWMDGWMKNKI